MKKIKHLFFLIFFPLIIYAQKNLDPRLNGIDILITGIMKVWNVPGCAITIVEKNNIILTKGYGYRKLDTKQPVNENTLFPIASCTKAFTAALIGIQADEGKIDLDKPANYFLPILKFSDPLLTLQVTPRDMMTHRTGIPRHDLSWFGFEKSPRDSLVQLIQYFDKSEGYKEKFQYNNYMYIALGTMVEHVNNGKTWEEQIKKRFFIPLEMNNSCVSYTELMNVENKAYPHAVSFQMKPIEVPFENSDNTAPCGSISSNAKDIAHWLITWINKGKYKNSIVIPSDFYKQAIATQWGSVSGPSGDIRYLGYGLGWNLAIYRGHYSVFHGGASNGFASLVLFLPSDSLGMAIFINSRTSPVPMIIANHITDKLLDLSYTDWGKRQLNSFIDQQKNYETEFYSKGPSEFSPTHNLDDYCGEYSNPGYGVIKILCEGDSLVGRYGSLKVWLKHYNYDAFNAIFYRSENILGKIDVYNRPAVFHQNSKGEISELTILLERKVDPIIFKKII
jgi:CubicO group peptidase (beta-lactamase class C family)